MINACLTLGLLQNLDPRINPIPQEDKVVYQRILDKRKLQLEVFLVVFKSVDETKRHNDENWVREYALRIHDLFSKM